MATSGRRKRGRPSNAEKKLAAEINAAKSGISSTSNSAVAAASSTDLPNKIRKTQITSINLQNLLARPTSTSGKENMTTRPASAAALPPSGKGKSKAKGVLAQTRTDPNIPTTAGNLLASVPPSQQISVTSSVAATTSTNASTSSAASTAATSPTKKSLLSEGSKLWVIWRDKSIREAVIIEKEWSGGEGTTADETKLNLWDYYVHYKDFNRRMDEWVTWDRVVDHGDKKKSDTVKIVKAVGNDKKSDEPTYIEPEDDEHEGMDEASIREHEQVTKVKNVARIELGRHIMETWYFSPYPKELFRKTKCLECMYLCEFCLEFFPRKAELRRHSRKCQLRHPPGDEIYRHEGVSMFEVDGRKSGTYCQNLCYMAKLFLDHKTLYYDVDPFLFYVMCEYDTHGFHIVGYYSKEKYSDHGYNLACILVLPAFQRKGYGNFIIQFSYELSKKEARVGSPEKPLSDLGKLSYRSYWIREILKVLQKNYNKQISLTEIAMCTSIKLEDIMTTLEYLQVLKYWNGQYLICVSPDLLKQYLKQKKKGRIIMNVEKLHWAPLEVEVKRDKWAFAGKKWELEDSSSKSHGH